VASDDALNAPRDNEGRIEPRENLILARERMVSIVDHVIDGIITLDENDVVRHHLVRRIIAAFEQASGGPPPAPGAAPGSAPQEPA
jgi:hypothetical protein